MVATSYGYQRGSGAVCGLDEMRHYDSSVNHIAGMNEHLCGKFKQKLFIAITKAEEFFVFFMPKRL